MQKKTSRRAVLALGLLSAATAGIPAAHAKVKHAAHKRGRPSSIAADSGGASTWHQSAALRSQLGSEVQVAGFALRPPQGYHLKQQAGGDQLSAVHVFLWQGDPRPDGSRATMMVQLVRVKPGAIITMTVNDQLAQVLNGVQRAEANLVHSDFQHGTVNDMSFARTYVKGEAVKNSKPDPQADGGDPQADDTTGDQSSTPQADTPPEMDHGFVYEGEDNDGKIIITMISQDKEPYYKATLPLLEASVLTLRKL